jgi:Fe-S-cluster containining protein
MTRIALEQVTDCTDCGACCTSQAALPTCLVAKHAGNFSVKPLPSALRKELEATVKRFMIEGWPADGTPCIWYDAETKKCRHYEYRPDVCHDLEVGSPGCLRWRRELGISKAKRFRLVGGKLVTA